MLWTKRLITSNFIILLKIKAFECFCNWNCTTAKEYSRRMCVQSTYELAPKWKLSALRNNIKWWVVKQRCFICIGKLHTASLRWIWIKYSNYTEITKFWDFFCTENHTTHAQSGKLSGWCTIRTALNALLKN